MESLYNRTPQVDFDGIHSLVPSVMSNNKSELVKVNGHGAISVNYEAANKLYTVFFIYVPYTLQEDVESDGNQLASGELFCSAIYTSPERHKSRFYFVPFKIKKSVTLSMNTVGIPNLYIKVWTHKSDFPQGDFLRSLTQPKITKQIFQTYRYWLLSNRGKIARMERVEYNTASGIHFMNVDDIEYFANL